ncbi:Hypothetical_protein [Hexamita inflata]|uniref:Hypothetical_protein n=1 Tax=Hexamita inflata TaxID=28002 RepID=A0ABP1KPT7_9EUKA
MTGQLLVECQKPFSKVFTKSQKCYSVQNRLSTKSFMKLFIKNFSISKFNEHQTHIPQMDRPGSLFIVSISNQFQQKLENRLTGISLVYITPVAKQVRND